MKGGIDRHVDRHPESVQEVPDGILVCDVCAQTPDRWVWKFCPCCGRQLVKILDNDPRAVSPPRGNGKPI